jgi:hypothetical protein
VSGGFDPNMRVTEFESPSRVGWKCVGGVDAWADNSFSFELEERDGATRLRFRQEYATELSDDEYGSFNFNWGYYLEWRQRPIGEIVMVAVDPAVRRPAASGAR